MSYLEKTLAPGEHIIYLGTRHWIIFLPGIILCLTIIGAVLGVPSLLLAWLRRRTSLYAVTNRRVIMRVGIFTKSSMEVLTNRIEEINVHQSFWGRILNYGTIRLIGTGGSREPFPLIADPNGFRAAVQNAAL